MERIGNSRAINHRCPSLFTRRISLSWEGGRSFKLVSSKFLLPPRLLLLSPLIFELHPPLSLSLPPPTRKLIILGNKYNQPATLAFRNGRRGNVFFRDHAVSRIKNINPSEWSGGPVTKQEEEITGGGGVWSIGCQREERDFHPTASSSPFFRRPKATSPENNPICVLPWRGTNEEPCSSLSADVTRLPD